MYNCLFKQLFQWSSQHGGPSNKVTLAFSQNGGKANKN
uniref:Uncharacterized protein n=1 Tax=Anguilla anguilla TaxID=7936 RepID=A0A0E9PQT4_ANGAN